MYITTLPSPVGQLTLASDGEGLTGLWLENQKYFAAGLAGSLFCRANPCKPFTYYT